jgi:hypothetical protein
MICYHFDKKLITTNELLKELNIPISQLDFWKTELRYKCFETFKTFGGKGTFKEWRKTNDPCWDMGLRLVGNKALWDPTVFLAWVYTNKIKNKPKVLLEQADNKKLIAFIMRNASVKGNN